MLVKRVVSGQWRWHSSLMSPHLGYFVGNYPEQWLVTCCTNGQCPKCIVSRNDIDDGILHDDWDHQAAQEVFVLSDEHPHIFNEACRCMKLKPVYHPFWEDLPYIDIFKQSLQTSPSIVPGHHQHLISWLKTAISKEEIDARCAWLLIIIISDTFQMVILILSCVSGTEHWQISSILLGLVLNAKLPGGYSLFVSSGPPMHSLTSSTRTVPIAFAGYIGYLEDALGIFHQNRSVFTDLGIRSHFCIPKFHSLIHYVNSIKLFRMMTL